MICGWTSASASAARKGKACRSGSDSRPSASTVSRWAEPADDRLVPRVLARAGRLGMNGRMRTAALIAIALLAACGKSPAQQAKEDASKQLADAGKQMEQAAKDMEAAAKKGGEGMADAMAKMGMAVGGAVSGAAKSAGAAVEPVDFRELKGLLPDGIGAMKRKSAEGEKGGGFGIVVSHAE